MQGHPQYWDGVSWTPRPRAGEVGVGKAHRGISSSPGSGAGWELSWGDCPAVPGVKSPCMRNPKIDLLQHGWAQSLEVSDTQRTERARETLLSVVYLQGN